MSLTGQVGELVTTGWQRGFLNYHHREAVLDRKSERASLANELIVVRHDSGMAGVQGTAKDFEEVGADHWRVHESINPVCSEIIAVSKSDVSDARRQLKRGLCA